MNRFCILEADVFIGHTHREIAVPVVVEIADRERVAEEVVLFRGV
jgi:hypothetical protein